MEYIEFLENENQRLTKLCEQYFRTIAYLSDTEGELRIPKEIFICKKENVPKVITYTDYDKFEYVIKIKGD